MAKTHVLIVAHVTLKVTFWGTPYVVFIGTIYRNTIETSLKRAHAAPQYFLRFTMGVGRNLLQDDFLGLPEHT